MRNRIKITLPIFKHGNVQRVSTIKRLCKYIVIVHAGATTHYAVMVPAACIRAAGVSQGGNRQDEKQDQGEKRKQTLSFHTKHKYPSFFFISAGV